MGLLPNRKEKLMFPDITRADADKDLVHCFKYLVNYGFYKFGVEVIYFFKIFLRNMYSEICTSYCAVDQFSYIKLDLTSFKNITLFFNGFFSDFCSKDYGNIYQL